MPTLADIISSLSPISSPVQPYETTEESQRAASVLIMLCEIQGVVHCLLNKRSEALRRHPGEVCFPGGMREDADTDVVHTAVRECEEEIGLRREDIKVVSVLPTLKVYQKTLLLTPIVATCAPDTFLNYNFTLNKDEVADIFHLPLSTFLEAAESPGSCLQEHVIDTTNPGFDVHNFHVLHQDKPFNVMGMTAHMCILVSMVGLQRAPHYDYSVPSVYLRMPELLHTSLTSLAKPADF